MSDKWCEFRFHLCSQWYQLLLKHSFYTLFTPAQCERTTFPTTLSTQSAQTTFQRLYRNLVSKVSLSYSHIQVSPLGFPASVSQAGTWGFAETTLRTWRERCWKQRSLFWRSNSKPQPGGAYCARAHWHHSISAEIRQEHTSKCPLWDSGVSRNTLQTNHHLDCSARET